jgi:hypothetical protein
MESSIACPFVLLSHMAAERKPQSPMGQLRGRRGRCASALGLSSFHNNIEFCDEGGDSAHRREHRRQNHTDCGYTDWYFHKCIAVDIFDDDPLNVALVNQRPYSVDKVTPENLNFLNKVL